MACPEVHPLNRDFTWRTAIGPFRRVTGEQARAFDELGFCVLEDVIRGDELATLRAEIDPWEERVERVLHSLPDKKAFIARAGEITFMTHLVRRSRRLRDFCAGALFRELTHDLIGPDVRLYWDQAVYKKPGAEKDFPWHQDNGYTFVTPQQYLTCWVPLTDATLDNGCPWVAPGLHRRGTLAHWMTDTGWRCLEDAVDAVPCPVRAGDMLVFSSLSPHRTGPNRTDAVRKAYIVQFAPDGARVLAQGAAGGQGTTCDDPERQFPILRGGRPAD